MKKQLFIAALLLIAVSTKAQVGINTQVPDATLDVKGKASTINVPDGIIAPRITKQELAAKASGTYGTAQTGALIYVSDITAPTGTIPSLAQVAEVGNTGYYYFNGSIWKSAGGIIDTNTNIYTDNGTLATNRIVDQGGKTLAFTGATTANAFSVDGTTLSVDAAGDKVGIGSTTPDATLDVEGKASTVTSADGIIAPRITKQELAAKTTGTYAFYQTGALVYVSNITTPTGTIPSIGQVTEVTSIGYYYFDGNIWKNAGGDSTNDAFINNTAGTKVELGTKSDGSTARTAGTEFSIQDNGAVVIGTSAAADASSVLDMSAITNKGILIPQVALTSNTDQVTTGTPKIGLMVYNTGVGALKTIGYFFWNGTEWRTLYNTSSINASITSLDCIDAKLSPTAVTSGTPYNGTLSLPYIGGNGGSYSAGTPFSSNGLTFTLQPGILANGPGFFTYSVSGTNPTFSSPSTVSVAIPALLGASSCSVTIGDTGVVKTMQYAKNTVSPINSGTPTASVTTIGNISVRLNATSGTASGTIFQYKLNNGITSWVTDNANWGGSGGATTNYHQFNGPDSRATNTWYSIGASVNIANSDSFVTYISLLNTKEIYRVSVVMNNTISGAPTAVSSATIFIEKLD